MEVHLLWHRRPLEGQEDPDAESDHIDTDDKLCGVSSTRARAEDARRRLVTEPDFDRFPDAFAIDVHAVGQVQWTGGFVTVADES